VETYLFVLSASWQKVRSLKVTIRILRTDTINVSINSKGRRTQEPSTLFGRSCCILTGESTHSPAVIQATGWKRASRGQSWHLE